MNNWTSKDFGRAAFMVGFGFVMGKVTAKGACEILGQAGEIALKKLAKKGVKTAQKYCQDFDFDYEREDNDEPKMKIGFC